MKRTTLEFMVMGALVVTAAWVRVERKHDNARIEKAAVETSYVRELPKTDAALPLRKVLFIGNSYTFYSDMPKMIPWMAASVAGQKFRYQTDMVATGGYHLMQHAQNDKVLRQILQGGYADVVLQEQSTLPMFIDGQAESLSATRALADNARLAHAVPVVYGTWPRRAGNEFYASQAYANIDPPRSPAEMMRRLDEFFHGLEKSAGVTYVPVGLYWMRGLAYFDLYAPDGSHPSLAGSYLAALLLYYAVSGDPPDAVHWAPPGLDDKEAAAIRTLAAQ